MKMNLIVTATGYAPADAEAIAARQKYHKPGRLVTAEVKVPRNPKFLRKYMALLRLGFDAWEPDGDQQYKGRPIEKDFDRFRKDVIITAGFFTKVWNLRGELSVEAQSIAFDRMEEEDFQRLYSATINVLIKQVMGQQGYTAESLDALVNDILRFD